MISISVSTMGILRIHTLICMCVEVPGADPGFQVRGGGAHLTKLRRAKGGAKIVGVFRVKNHDFTPKKSNFFQC
jgi:hypothetical protein